MFAEVGGAALPDELPREWLELYKKVDGRPPGGLRDIEATASTPSVSKRVDRLIAELHRNIPLLKP